MQSFHLHPSLFQIREHFISSNTACVEAPAEQLLYQCTKLQSNANTCEHHKKQYGTMYQQRRSAAQRAMKMSPERPDHSQRCAKDTEPVLYDKEFLVEAVYATLR